MATVNKQSLREEFDALKARFESLCAEGKMSADSRALVDALLMLFEVLIADSGPTRSPIPAQADHRFRFKPITDSGPTRSPIPVPSRSLFGRDRNGSGRLV